VDRIYRKKSIKASLKIILPKNYLLDKILQNSLKIPFQLREEGEEMPSYEYRCPKCSKKFTLILSIAEHDAKKAKCPKCGGRKLEQLITAFQVKTSRKS